MVTMNLHEATEHTYTHRWAAQRDGEKSRARALRCLEHLPKEPTRRDYATLAVKLAGEGMSDATVNRHLAALRVVLRTRADLGGPAAPALPGRREPESRQRVFSDAELGRLAGGIGQDNPAAGRLVTFLAETGLRLGEALALRWSDFGPDMVTVRRAKGGRPRVVPLTRPALDALGCWDPEHSQGRVWEGLTESTFRRLWQRTRESMGLLEDPEAVPHALRHTCATRLGEAGVGLHVIQEWLGHRDLKTTAGYLHATSGALKAAARKLEGGEV